MTKPDLSQIAKSPLIFEIERRPDLVSVWVSIRGRGDMPRLLMMQIAADVVDPEVHPKTNDAFNAFVEVLSRTVHKALCPSTALAGFEHVMKQDPPTILQ